MASSRGESPGGLAGAVALAEPEAADRTQQEHERPPAQVAVAEGAVADHEAPGPGPVLRGERLGDGLQLGVVGDLLGGSLEHDIEGSLDKLAAARRQDARCVLREVPRLALV